MTTAVSRLIEAANLAAAGLQAVQKLRKAGANTLADAVQRECDAQCKRLVARIRNSRASAARARRAPRGRFGRFS